MRWSRTARLVALLTLLALLFGAAAAIAYDVAGSGVENEADDPAGEDAAEGPDVPITGPDLATASSAALDFLGEGRVTATEVGDEESYYEVEVTLDSGHQIDVQLDESFVVVGTD